MGRELRRVPMDFDYPLGNVWYGHLIDCAPTCINSGDDDHCIQCIKMAEIKGIPIKDGCPDFDEYLAEPIAMLKQLLAPPKGEGYQLWETTTEGSPMSPVFTTLDELCEWCEINATTFAHFKATKEQWKSMLEDDCVCHKEGNVVFL